MKNTTRRASKHFFAGTTRIASENIDFDPVSEGDITTNPVLGKNQPALYLHQDHLGSTSVLTNQAGAPLEYLQYFADGDVWIDKGTQQPENGYKFSGKFFDPESGLYDFGARFYDPKTSLWLGVDPPAFEGPGYMAGSPTAASLYNYTSHSPFARIDPDGRQDKPASNQIIENLPPDSYIPIYYDDPDALRGMALSYMRANYGKPLPGITTQEKYVEGGFFTYIGNDPSDTNIKIGPVSNKMKHTKVGKAILVLEFDLKLGTPVDMVHFHPDEGTPHFSDEDIDMGKTITNQFANTGFTYLMHKKSGFTVFVTGANKVYRILKPEDLFPLLDSEVERIKRGYKPGQDSRRIDNDEKFEEILTNDLNTEYKFKATLKTKNSPIQKETD